MRACLRAQHAQAEERTAKHDCNAFNAMGVVEEEVALNVEDVAVAVAVVVMIAARPELCLIGRDLYQLQQCQHGVAVFNMCKTTMRHLTMSYC